MRSKGGQMRLMIAVSAVFVVFALGTASAQMRIAMPISGTIRVIGDGPDAHEPIRVTLDSSGVPVRETFTRDGQFVFANVSPGSYSITVHNPQYADVNFPVVV